MINRWFRTLRRPLRWIQRLAGLFLAFFAYELLSGPYQTDYFGAADPYIGAAVAYVIGGWVVTLVAFWIIRTFTTGLLRIFSRR